MKTRTLIPSLALACGVALALAPWSSGDQKPVDDQHAAHAPHDVDQLFALVRQARADLAAIRRAAGLERERGEKRRDAEHGGHEHGGVHGREGHGEHGAHARGEHGAGHEARADREGRGEHGGREGGRTGGEEGGQRLDVDAIWDSTRNGARLRLRYDRASRAFIGTVWNTTDKPLDDVRVEVHLSNGTELGPTKRTTLKPRESMRVELSAAEQRFSWWTTHPEHGNEENHGPGHEEGGDEHGRANRDDRRPKDPALRPLYNQLQLLRHEIRTLRHAVEQGRER